MIRIQKNEKNEKKKQTNKQKNKKNTKKIQILNNRLPLRENRATFYIITKDDTESYR